MTRTHNQVELYAMLQGEQRRFVSKEGGFHPVGVFVLSVLDVAHAMAWNG
jgi:hypothetical protein